MRSNFRVALALALALALGVGATAARADNLDSDGLGKAPYGRMHMLLEKTFLNVDVLTVDIRFAPETADALRGLAAGQKKNGELTNRIADLAYRAEDAYIEVVFKRDVDLDDFVTGVRDSLKRARKANMIDEENFQNVSKNLPRWFAFLKDDGIKSGDKLLYRARAQSMRTQYVDRTGKVRLDQTDQGAGPRLALLSGYFAPGSDFKEGLIESLFGH